MLPAAGILNHGLPQDTRRAVEVEKQPAAGARDVFQHEVAVQQDRLHFGQDVMTRFRYVQRVCTMPTFGSVK